MYPLFSVPLPLSSTHSGIMSVINEGSRGLLGLPFCRPRGNGKVASDISLPTRCVPFVRYVRNAVSVSTFRKEIEKTRQFLGTLPFPDERQVHRLRLVRVAWQECVYRYSALVVECVKHAAVLRSVNVPQWRATRWRSTRRTSLRGAACINSPPSRSRMLGLGIHDHW